ncbi:DUF4485 domain-containing protein, partial [archaeon]
MSRPLPIESLWFNLILHVMCSVRVERWCEKLAGEAVGDVYRRNRNAVAAALHNCVAANDFTPPFDKAPGDGPLPNIPQYVASAALASLKVGRGRQPGTSNTSGACVGSRTSRGRSRSAQAAWQRVFDKVEMAIPAARLTAGVCAAFERAG